MHRVACVVPAGRGVLACSCCMPVSHAHPCRPRCRQPARGSLGERLPVAQHPHMVRHEPPPVAHVADVSCVWGVAWGACAVRPSRMRARLPPLRARMLACGRACSGGALTRVALAPLATLRPLHGLLSRTHHLRHGRMSRGGCQGDAVASAQPHKRNLGRPQAAHRCRPAWHAPLLRLGGLLHASSHAGHGPMQAMRATRLHVDAQQRLHHVKVAPVRRQVPAAARCGGSAPKARSRLG